MKYLFTDFFQITFLLYYHYLDNVFFLFLLFFVLHFSKPKLIYQDLLESLRKQQLRGVLLNIYVFNLITLQNYVVFQQHSSLLRKPFNVVSALFLGVIWRRDVGQCQINVEITLFMSTLLFTTLSNVKSTLSISTFILTTLGNVEAMFLFSTPSFTTLINVGTTL